MTIKDYMSKQREQDERLKSADGVLYSEMMADTMDVWSNNACKGYLIEAAQSEGLTPEAIKNLLNALEWAFDTRTVDEVESIYKAY